MIKTTDLIQWAKDHSVSCSLQYPYGWIRGDDLISLAQTVKGAEPFVYSPSPMRGDGTDGVAQTDA